MIFYMFMSFFPLEALTQMSSVVEVWQAEDADFFMPSQVCELIKTSRHELDAFITVQLHFIVSREHVRDVLQCAIVTSAKVAKIKIRSFFHLDI